MAQDNNFWRGVFKIYSKHQHKLDDLVAAGAGMEHLVNWRGFSWTNFQTRAIELKLASFQKSLSGPNVGVEKKLDLSLDLNSIKTNPIN